MPLGGLTNTSSPTTGVFVIATEVSRKTTTSFLVIAEAKSILKTFMPSVGLWNVEGVRLCHPFASKRRTANRGLTTSGSFLLRHHRVRQITCGWLPWTLERPETLRSYALLRSFGRRARVVLRPRPSHSFFIQTTSELSPSSAYARRWVWSHSFGKKPM